MRVILVETLWKAFRRMDVPDHSKGILIYSIKSTSILECAKKVNSRNVHVEWAPNEKVALETVLGASAAGFRGLAVMKQVGVNVAADPIMSAVTWGVRGGVIIVAGDDPGCDGSPVEQDSRCYGVLANVPVLEPSTPEEAQQMITTGFTLSEEFSLPIILRITKEFSAMRGKVIKTPVLKRNKLGTKLEGWGWGDPVKGHSLRHEKMERIITKLSQFNSKEINGNLGIITSGCTYHDYLMSEVLRSAYLQYALRMSLSIKGFGCRLILHHNIDPEVIVRIMLGDTETESVEET